jgi:hypothetical protein
VDYFSAMQTDLFGDVERSKKKTETWVLTNHACRHCCGRLLKRQVSPTVTEVMCAKCETRSFGNELTLCWCGQSAGSHGKIFECIPNPNRRPELPNAVMVRERAVIMKPAEKRPSRYVSCPDHFE